MKVSGTRVIWGPSIRGLEHPVPANARAERRIEKDSRRSMVSSRGGLPWIYKVYIQIVRPITDLKRFSPFPGPPTETCEEDRQ
jgi:hypothetical protein